MMFKWLFYIFIFLIYLGAIFPFWNIGWWWVRAFDFPRLQLFLLNTILILILLSGLIIEIYSSQFFTILITLVLCLGLDVYRIYPYAFSNKQESASYNNEASLGTFSVLTANVLISNDQQTKILDLIENKDPSLVLLLETHKKWADACEALKEKYPYNILLPQENGYGILFYSKFPLKNTQVKYLVDQTVPSIFTDIQINPNLRLHFIGLHPRPPRPSDGDSDQRDSELMLVAEYIKSQKNTPILVAGDINDVAWSHTTRLFRRLSGTLDPRIGRGMFNTFNADSIFLRFPLDHYFHTPDLMISEIARLEHVGSDHFPLWAKFHILKNDTLRQTSEKPDSEDKAEMEELQSRGDDWVSPDKSKNDKYEED